MPLDEEGLLPLELLPIPGTNTTLATRIARTPERSWVAWVTGHADTVPTAPGGGGRVGLMRASTHEHGIVGPLDGSIDVTDFDEPVDIAVVEYGEGARAYFVYARATSSGAEECRRDHGVRCSGLRHLTWDGADGFDFSAERTLEHGSVRHIAISRDNQFAFITRRGGSELMVWDLGDGAFERFERHSATPSIPSVSRPAALWLP